MGEANDDPKRVLSERQATEIIDVMQDEGLVQGEDEAMKEVGDKWQQINAKREFVALEVLKAAVRGIGADDPKKLKALAEDLSDAAFGIAEAFVVQCEEWEESDTAAAIEEQAETQNALAGIITTTAEG